jgi:hypothetical protein
MSVALRMTVLAAAALVALPALPAVATWGQCPLVLTPPTEWLADPSGCDVMPGSTVDHFSPSFRGAAPHEDASLLAFGTGAATATLNGQTKDCLGSPTAALEAGIKPFGVEPAITFAYGNAYQQGSFLLPCEQGQKVQPSHWDLQPGAEFPHGAWRAVKVAGGHTWTVEVGAPSDGLREVTYSYEAPDESAAATFHGFLHEYR